MLDTATIRPQFPILETSVHGKPLIYLDNAATTQKPLAVLDATRNYYETQNANVHRGSHYLSQLATEAHEESRETVAPVHQRAGNGGSPVHLRLHHGHQPGGRHHR